MKIELKWIEQEESILSEVRVTESNPEEITRFSTRFEHDLNRGTYLYVINRLDDEEAEDRACYAVWSNYIDNEYYRDNYGTRKEFINMTESKIKYLIERDDYYLDTNTTLMNAIVKKLKKEHLYDRFQAIMEYYLPEASCGDIVLVTRPEFEIISYVNGGSEGTWLNCYISGRFDEGKNRKIPLGTFKTLEEDLNAALIMGELGGAIYHIGNQYVNDNYDRFSLRSKP